VKRLAIFLAVAVCVSCKPAQQQPSANKPAAAEPQVRATVVTIRTTTTPDKSFDHTIVIAGDRARSTGEHETWRLFDTKADTVTYVDDAEKTIRTEALASIVKTRGATLAAALPAHFPRAKLARTKERKTFLGANAQQLVIESGAYRRELWLGEHPQIPRGLFAMMHASDTPSSPLAPMMRAVDEVLVRERGFPLSDRTEVPLGNDKLVVERTVTGIVQREVPETLLALPKDYKDLTPKPKPAQ